MKLIYTDKGLKECREMGTLDLGRINLNDKPMSTSVKPHSIRILALSKQSNLSRLS